MRLFLSSTTGPAERGVRRAIVLIYDHDVHEVGEALHGIQHHSRSVINSVLHIHIDEKNCLEILA
jgi:CopG family nickel-responsive transcriptional regulator